MSDKKERPYCFGDLDTVFPMGEKGLRETPESCMLCCHCKTECLREAMQGKKGNVVKTELVDKAYDSGMISFFERWSRKKHLYKKIKIYDKKI